MNRKIVLVGIIALVVFIVFIVLYNNAQIKVTISDMFHSGIYLNNNKNYWWLPFSGAFSEYNNSMKFTDKPLPNLYRKWHNIESVNRNEVLEHQHVQNAGGDHMINRQWLIAEKLDREAATTQRQINDQIASNRIPWSDANNLSSPINFPYDTYDIIGIPSVPGTLHAYY